MVRGLFLIIPQLHRSALLIIQVCFKRNREPGQLTWRICPGYFSGVVVIFKLENLGRLDILSHGETSFQDGDTFFAGR